MEAFTGKVWVLGDDIDTDIIIPTEYLALKTIDDMKQYGFSPLRPELAGQIEAVRAAMEDQLGYVHHNAVMSFATLSLPVSPEVKLTDKGLLIGKTLEFIPLIKEEHA